MSEFIPFIQEYDENDDAVYKFRIQSDNPAIKKPYQIEITIDGMNDDLLIKTTCTCAATFYKPNLKACKHINMALHALHEFNVAFREENNELSTEKKGEDTTSEPISA